MVKNERIFYNYTVIGKRLAELYTMQDVPKDEGINEEFKFNGTLEIL
jgi:hypothetical protein